MTSATIPAAPERFSRSVVGAGFTFRFLENRSPGQRPPGPPPDRAPRGYKRRGAALRSPGRGGAARVLGLDEVEAEPPRDVLTALPRDDFRNSLTRRGTGGRSAGGRPGIGRRPGRSVAGHGAAWRRRRSRPPLNDFLAVRSMQPSRFVCSKIDHPDNDRPGRRPTRPRADGSAEVRRFVRRAEAARLAFSGWIEVESKAPRDVLTALPRAGSDFRSSLARRGKKARGPGGRPGRSVAGHGAAWRRRRSRPPLNDFLAVSLVEGSRFVCSKIDHPDNDRPGRRPTGPVAMEAPRGGASFAGPRRRGSRPRAGLRLSQRRRATF